MASFFSSPAFKKFAVVAIEVVGVVLMLVEKVQSDEFLKTSILNIFRRVWSA